MASYRVNGAETVQKIGGDMGITKIVEVLESSGCGFTLDAFKDQKSGKTIIQWISSSPQNDESTTSKAGIHGRINLDSIPNNQALDIGLTNSVDQSESCPFQPEQCVGPHIVATGSGLL